MLPTLAWLLRFPMPPAAGERIASGGNGQTGETIQIEPRKPIVIMLHSFMDDATEDPGLE